MRSAGRAPVARGRSGSVARREPDRRPHHRRRADHLAFIEDRRSASFLQTPAWGKVKSEWRHESIGWFRDGELVGAGLVLYRQLPEIAKFLAYLPEGPVLDWSAPDLPDAARPHGRAPQGPRRVRRSGSGRRWSPAAGRPRRSRARSPTTGTSGSGTSRPDSRSERGRACRGRRCAPPAGDPGRGDDGLLGGAAAVRLPAPVGGPGRGRRARGHEPAVAAQHQEGRQGRRRGARSARPRRPRTPSIGCTSRPPRATASHLARSATSSRCSPPWQQEDPDRIRLYLAHHEGDLVAATTAVRRRSPHVWYSYGASSTAKRDVRGSNAVQWQMIRDAMAAGADVYDLRGITDTLAADDPHIGLIQFKVGTGGQAVEYVGEWDLPLNRLLYKAFDVYMSRRRVAMSLDLYVDGPRWRAHLRATADAHPGHHSGREGQRLRLRAGRAGTSYRSGWAATRSPSAPTGEIARGTATLRTATSSCSSPGVRSPTDVSYDPRIVHTVGRTADLAGASAPATTARASCSKGSPRCAGTASRCRTCWPRRVGRSRGAGGGTRAPPAPWRGPRTTRSRSGWRRTGAPVVRLARRAARARPAAPDRIRDVELRPRVGTALWLGDRDALSARATVLDVHPVARGDRVGYRQRRIPRSGTLLVVSGGTSHGIGLEAPSAAASLTTPARSLAKGGLEAAGRGRCRRTSSTASSAGSSSRHTCR